MTNNVTLTIRTIIAIGMLVISILSIIGLYYLTKFSFNANSNKTSNSYVACVNDITNSDLTYCRLTVVLLWINIGLSVLASIISFLNK